MDTTPPNPGHVSPGELPSLLKLAGTARKHRAAINDALFLFATSCTQYLGEFFESDVVSAAMGWHAINDSVAGPSTPGTAYVLLHDHAAEQAGGGLRTWGFVRGGIGRVTAGDGRRGPRGRRRDPHLGRGRAGRRRRRPGHRGRAGRRIGDRSGPRPLQRRSAAHVLRPRRRGAPARPLQRLAPQLPLRGHEREDQPRRRPAARGDRNARRPRALSRRDHGVRRLHRRHGPGPVRGQVRDGSAATRTSSAASRPSTIPRWPPRASTC